ncbi:unnamed protein product [Microthlaspi erraticum]|uniref:DUF8039 domain-containing protein n=1 Tax=Microthlaspi erraticum TaxID=1685480 RepID=A0A6D2JQE5_9BRAS|nr:unnamed protein product [Microthlaspi erraticum]CAA7039525.1 unnamed protein product [Microthlaspi erraticum]
MNPRGDLLSQVLGPDNPGRLRAMGRSMSMSKLACFQVKSKLMDEMQEKQFHLIHKRQEPEVGENSAAAKSVNKKSQPRFVLVDWYGSNEDVATRRILSFDPADFVNDIPLGPVAVKILVETAKKEDGFLWRPAPAMFTIGEAVGHIIAWPSNNCVISDQDLEPEDIAPRAASANSINKCKLLDWSTNDEVVGEGRWQSKEPKALVNGLPLGPNAVKVYVDVVHAPETFLWRPTAEKTYLEDSLMSFVAWTAGRVVYEDSTDGEYHISPSRKLTPYDKVATSKSASTSTRTASPASTKSQQTSPQASLKKPQPPSESNIQGSLVAVGRENQKVKLMDISGKKCVVAEGRWASNNPEKNVHFVPLGNNTVRVWIDIVNVKDAAVWRPCSEIEAMEDAIGTSIAWPEDNVILC